MEDTQGETNLQTIVYTYHDTAQRISAQIATMRTTRGTAVDITYSYTYDNNGNILTVSDGTNTTSYVYDSANQLIRENNQAAGKTWTWTYDSAGNILSKNEYAYTTGDLGTLVDTIPYTYNDADWGDLLTAYDGTAITYDTIGNPLNDGTWTYTWQNGRELATMSDGTVTWRYTYDANGMRTRRSGNNVPHGYEYIYNGGSLSQVIVDQWQTLKFTYDANGIPMTVNYENEDYYYITNLLGDVLGIADSTGTLVVSYTYDAWGKPLSITGSMADTLGVQNPLRYRGYVYDQETGLYYLQSRYYDPEIGRFINADNQLSASDMTSMNLFAYCGNNPVSRIDPTGEAWWHWALGAVVVAACAVATVVTCGGFAAAATAVCMVGSGVAAATTASTVAAAAFIGSATVYGTAVLAAASRSSSVEEFNAQGNWGTVAVTAGGALAGGYSGYAMSKTPQTTTTDTYTSRGSTGRTEPQNLKEKLAMEQVQASPLDGAMQLPIRMTDPRWPATEGWVKMASNVNGVEIHFVYNTIIQIFDDFKFKG